MTIAHQSVIARFATQAKVDDAMSTIGSRSANKQLGKPLTFDLDEELANQLKTNEADECEAIADVLLDICGFAEVTRGAMKSGATLSADETADMVEFLYDLEDDAIALMKDVLGKRRERPPIR